MDDGKIVVTEYDGEQLIVIQLNGNEWLFILTETIVAVYFYVCIIQQC